LIKFLKELLLEEVIEVTSFLSQKHNLQFSKIRLTNNKTKWGSCNSKGVLSFNWRLVFATKEVLDYLIVHEMSHLTHMNHSKKFWNLVEKIYPNYKTAKLWLKQNGKKLHLYLV
jgi:predicted metal-dependent hydrolase